MNPTVGWIVWHLTRGYSQADTLAAWTARYGAPPALTWADGLAIAQAQIALPGGIQGAAMSQTVGQVAGAALLGTGTVDITFQVTLRVGASLKVLPPEVVAVSAQMTIQDLWNYLFSLAAQDQSRYGGQINLVSILP